MSKLYDVRPSVLLDIPDAYTSYCFDEACAYILGKLKDGKKPVFKKSAEKGRVKQHYNKLSDMYKAMGFDNNSYVKINSDS